MSKPLNHDRRLRQAEKAMRANETPAQRDPVALALALHYRSQRFEADSKKIQDKRACRGKVDY